MAPAVPASAATDADAAWSRAIVARHGGTLAIGSNPPAGRCIRLWLPVAQRDATAEKAEKA